MFAAQRTREVSHAPKCTCAGANGWAGGNQPQAPDEDSENGSTKTPEIPTVQEAINTYLGGLKRRSGKNLLKPTVSKHRTVAQRLADFAIAEKLTLISEIDFDVLDRFREKWDSEFNLAPQTAANYITRLAKMGRYFVKKKWWKENYADDLEKPEDYTNTTKREPLTDQQVEMVLEAARTVKLDPQSETTNEEIETFILLMLKGGMAIGDASLFEDSELEGDTLRYYRKKRERRENKILVVFPLEPQVAERFRAMKKTGLHQGKYFFCRGSLDNASDVWHKRLAMVFEAAGVKGTPHQFRHTFAYRWFNTLIEFPPGSGQYCYTPVEYISKWMGHENVRTTLRYYKHWVKKNEIEASDIVRSVYRAAQSLTYNNAATL